MKLLPIQNCSQCIHHHYGFFTWKCKLTNIKSTYEAWVKMPKQCPLEDAKKPEINS